MPLFTGSDKTNDKISFILIITIMFVTKKCYLRDNINKDALIKQENLIMKGKQRIFVFCKNDSQTFKIAVTISLRDKTHKYPNSKSCQQINETLNAHLILK
jgi:hypothetical protein